MRRSLFFTISILLIIALGASYGENLFNHGPSNVDGSASRIAKTNPSTVGGGVTNDLVGDLGSGTLSSDSVTFAISGFTSETSSCPTFGGCGGEIDSNVYGIQIKPKTFTCHSTF